MRTKKYIPHYVFSYHGPKYLVGAGTPHACYIDTFHVPAKSRAEALAKLITSERGKVSVEHLRFRCIEDDEEFLKYCLDTDNESVTSSGVGLDQGIMKGGAR